MADIREPVAWVNSARMSGAFYMYVEGDSDERFWNKFIDSNHVKLQVCHGCKQLFKIVNEHILQNELHFIAVTDRDFHAILGSTPKLTNLFFTDDHDLELMMYHKGKAFAEMKNAIDRGGKIKAYEQSGHNLLEETMEITDDIGYCRLASHKVGFDFLFSYEEEKTHDIIRPKYEGALNGNTGAYLGIDRIVSKVHGFTISCKHKPPKENELVQAAIAEKKNTYDTWQLSNGHEVSYLLPYLIRRRCKHNNTKMDQDYIDSVLYAAYDVNDFHLTDLYAEMYHWARNNKIKLFK